MLFFELRDRENRIREVQLVYREVVPRLYDPPDRWNKAIFLITSLQGAPRAPKADLIRPSGPPESPPGPPEPPPGTPESPPGPSQPSK